MDPCEYQVKLLKYPLLVQAYGIGRVPPNS